MRLISTLQKEISIILIIQKWPAKKFGAWKEPRINSLQRITAKIQTTVELSVAKMADILSYEKGISEFYNLSGF